MNQKLFSGLTAALLVSAFGLAPSGYADQARNLDEQSGVQVPESGVAVNQVASVSAPESTIAPRPVDSAELEAQSSAESPSAPETKVAAPAMPSPAVATTSTPVSPDLAIPQTDEIQTPEAVKVGEYQSRDAARADAAVATIQPHVLRGRHAATLYVRNIPVLTFLGGEATAADAAGSTPAIEPEVKVASVQTPVDTSVTATPGSTESIATKLAAPTAASSTAPAADSRDPVWRATTTAAHLNQLYRDNVSADEIKIAWNADRQKYVIQANDQAIVVLDADSVLPDTVSSSASDVLQVTNRIRRQMGNASPLSSIEGDPNGYGQISLGPVSLRVSGYASWYGPGFDGAYSASGEIFNQEALTAAHPSLPFGTQVRVTNLDNGQSVTVRINDRGPFAHNRVIDLSAGAARIIGLIHSGVAPVSLEVLGAVQ